MASHRQFLRSFLSRAGLLIGLLALWGLGYLFQMLDVMEWLDSLPFAYQVVGKIGLLLLLLVVPFATIIFFASRHKDA